MITFLLAHSDTRVSTNTTILTKEGLKQLKHPNYDIGSDYAMGWQLTRSKNGYEVIHNCGDLNTYHSDVIIIPEKGYRIVMMVNQNSYLYSTVVNNSLKNAIANHVLGNINSQSMPVLIKYLESAGIVIQAIIVYQVLSLLCLVKQKKITNSGNKFRIIISIVKDCLIPVILLIVLPKFASVFLNRGVNLRESFNMQPDVTLSCIIISVFCCIKAIVKIALVMIEYFRSIEEERSLL